MKRLLSVLFLGMLLLPVTVQYSYSQAAETSAPAAKETKADKAAAKKATAEKKAAAKKTAAEKKASTKSAKKGAKGEPEGAGS